MAYWELPYTHRVRLAHLRAFDFWALVEIGGEDECWRLKSSSTEHRSKITIPAGIVPHTGKVDYSGARAAKSLAMGRLVPRHLVVDHLCFNPPCVNPKHLDVVTQRTNLKRRRMPANA